MYINIPANGNRHWKSPVASISDLPSAPANSLGDTRVVTDTQEIYIWDGSSWVLASGGGGSSNAFGTIQTPAGTSPVAEAPSDVVTFTSSDSSILITGNATTDSVDFKVVPGGSNTQIQFNDSGVLAGDSALTWNKTTNQLTLNGPLELPALTPTNDALVINGSGIVSLPGGTKTSGYVLKYNGTNVVWDVNTATPGGSNTQIQFNDSGSLAGDTALTWNKTTNELTLNGTLQLPALTPADDVLIVNSSNVVDLPGGTKTTGYVIKFDGTNVVWDVNTPVPGGSIYEIQYNDGMGNLAGDPSFTFNGSDIYYNKTNGIFHFDGSGSSLQFTGNTQTVSFTGSSQSFSWAPSSSTFVWAGSSNGVTFGDGSSSIVVNVVGSTGWQWTNQANSYYNVLNIDGSGNVGHPTGTFTDGYVLTWHSGGISWDASTSATPGGTTYDVQYNNGSGGFGGSSGLQTGFGGTSFNLAYGPVTFSSLGSSDVLVLNSSSQLALPGGSKSTGYVLTFDGSNPVWAVAPGGGSAGVSGDVQLSNGSGGFTYYTGFNSNGTTLQLTQNFQLPSLTANRYAYIDSSGYLSIMPISGDSNGGMFWVTNNIAEIGDSGGNYCPANVYAYTNIQAITGSLTAGTNIGLSGNLVWNAHSPGYIGDNGSANPLNVYVDTLIQLNSLTANTALIADTNKQIVSSSVDSTELTYLDDVEPLNSATLVDNTASPTNLLSWATASFTAIQIDYSISRAGTDFEKGTLHIITDGSSTASVSNGTPAVIGSPGVTFGANYSAGTVYLDYTTTNTGSNATLKYKVQKWLA